jgi:hypothetical protein
MQERWNLAMVTSGPRRDIRAPGEDDQNPVSGVGPGWSPTTSTFICIIQPYCSSRQRSSALIHPFLLQGAPSASHWAHNRNHSCF